MNSTDLRKMQLLQVDIMREFDRLCRENGIKYIMDAGTLLGAVRHKGFIPWDDDIDVRMLRSEYEKFRKIADKLQNGVYFQDYYNDKYYPWIYSKVRLEGTKAIRLGQEKIPMRDGVFIDIFPCDGIPEDKKEFVKKCKVAQICRRILYSRTAKYTSERFFEKVKWNLVSIVPKSWVHKVIKSMSEKYDDRQAEKVGCLGWHAPKDVNGFKKEWFTDLIDMEFEGKQFMAPKDWDGFLRFSFGDDYMTPPPEDQRETTAPLSYYYLGE